MNRLDPPNTRTILITSLDAMAPDADFTLEVDDEAPRPPGLVRSPGRTILMEVDDEAPRPPGNASGLPAQPVPAVLISGAWDGAGQQVPFGQPPSYNRLFAVVAVGGLLATSLLGVAVVHLLSTRAPESLADGKALLKREHSAPDAETRGSGGPRADLEPIGDKASPDLREPPKNPAVGKEKDGSGQPETPRQPAPAREKAGPLPLQAPKDPALEDGSALPRPLVGPAAVAASVKSLQRIGRGLHDYLDARGRFPAHAIYGKDGTALLSWRVALLPFIDQKALYEEFKLDEPWDSEHNKKLMARMPRIYAPLSEAERKNGLTIYQVFVGKGTLFEGTQGLRLADIPRGTSNIIAVVEGDKAVTWTKPDDLLYSADKPLPRPAGRFKDGFNALFADALVRWVSPALISEKDLRLAITRNDGKAVDREEKENDTVFVIDP